MDKWRLLAGIAVFGSLWGFSECIIGSYLRDVGLPAGGIMTGVFAIGLMTLSRLLYRERGMQLGMGLVAGGLRLANPFGGCFICSAFAIMAEGAIFEAVWYRFSLDSKESSLMTIRASMGILSGYLVFVGGYIVTQILTPLVSSAGFYLENLVVFLPQILASGLLPAILGCLTVSVVFVVVRMPVTLKDRLYYPLTVGISAFCWVAVIINTVILLKV